MRPSHVQQSESTSTFRKCADCGVPIVQGDPAHRAYGAVFCSEECIDSFEQDTYGEDPLGGSWS